MNYVIADIHGCYKEFKNLIEKLKLTEQDFLYILGDAIDRGPHPIKTIQFLMSLKNIEYIMGNHDYMFFYFLGQMGLDWNPQVFALCEEKLLNDFNIWLEDGGMTTLKEYINLTNKEKKEIYQFFENAIYYKKIEMKEKSYVLVHAGIKDFKEEKQLNEYKNTDFLFERIDYNKRYYDNTDTYLLTGHTPTQRTRKDKKAKILEKNGHIAIDCGCVYGGKLAAYCIEMESAIYSD